MILKILNHIVIIFYFSALEQDYTYYRTNLVVNYRITDVVIYLIL